jgi:serine/threonine protein kinase
MQCPRCGTVNKADARYCASCGEKLENENSLANAGPASVGPTDVGLTDVGLTDVGLLQPGQLVGEGIYRIIRLLGKGGMGAVYLAANTRAFDRPCVVKEIIEYYDPTDPEARRRAIERFEAEARTLAALKHAGIPDIYAYFTESERNYLVMEYIEGPNLAQGLTRERDGRTVQGGPQPVKDVIQYTVQVCEVLAYLEQQEPPVIHNDIKPANVILDKNTGRAVLVDFGTAKTRYAPHGAEQPGHPPGRPGSQQSSIYGTIGYAAPELYEGKAEPRSDVFALAATAYHLLTDDDPRIHPFQFPKMDGIPDPPRQALVDALELDVGLRLSAAQLSARLRSTLDAKAVSPPKFKVVTERLIVDPDREDASRIVLTNAGDAELSGTATSSEPWVRVTGQFKCAPGQTGALPLAIDLSDLKPGQTYHASVKIAVAGTSPIPVPVEVRVPPPLLKITPMQIDLGTISRNQVLTSKATFKVQNIGKSRAVCQIQADAPWLVLDPTRFICVPGQTQTVDLAGRTDLVPAQGDRHKTTLHLDVEGGYPRQVQVSLAVRQVRSRVRSVVMVGSALAILVGAIAWFVLTVLPLLVP